jgi:hypothetical protein
MRPQNQAARDRLEAELRKSACVSAAQLAKRLEVSVPTLLRMLRERANRIVRVGATNRARYALRHPLRGVIGPLPLFRVDEAGQGFEVGALDLIEPAGSALDLVGMGWPADESHRDGWWEGLPYPLHDLRPQGFLGRAFARTHAADLDIPADPNAWSDDQVAYVLSRYVADGPGNLILGEAAYARWMKTIATPTDTLPDSKLGGHYVKLAEQVTSLGVVGSSAAGEFPKFTAARDLPGSATPHVIVKFSGSGDSGAVRRWADLLICEHLALTCLGEMTGLPVAASRILTSQGRTFLEVERFDRHGAFGRSETLTLASLDAALQGSTSHNWPPMVERIATELKLAAPGLQQTVNLTWWYGRLIANTDMHAGNLSFQFTAMPGERPQLRAAPVYDMLPMLYAPLAGGEVPAREFTPPMPLPNERTTWQTACGAALSFWLRAANDLRISEPFRALAQANYIRLAELRQRC